MIWSLVHHVEQSPNKLSAICLENLLEKSSFILYGGHYALSSLENPVGIYICSLNICKEVETKAC